MSVGNLRAGRRRRYALLSGVCLLVVVSVAGVAARPSLGMRAAELEFEQARLRGEEREAVAARLERFESSGGEQRARTALARLARLLPRPLPELELHGLLRLLAERRNLLLETLEIAEPAEVGLERLDDVAALREVRLAGRGTLGDVLGFVAELRALGRPLSVLEFQLDEAGTGARARWTLALGIFESRPLEEFPELGSANEQESP